MKIERSSNIELLRILAMFLIVQSHFAFHGYWTDVCHGDWGVINNLLNQSLLRSMITGNLGNIIFMLITGFFLCKSDKLIIRKLLSVIIQVFTYSIVCYFVYTIGYGSSVFHFKDIFKAATPLIHDTYWYFSAYVLIYLFHPFINRLINNISQKEFGFLILTMAIVWEFIPTFLNLNFGSSSFLNFLFFYFIGAYFRLYYTIGKGFECGNESCQEKTSSCIRQVYYWQPAQNRIIVLICCLLWFGFGVLQTMVPATNNIRLFRFVLMGYPLAILLSVSLFVLFLNWTSIKPSRTINTIAACTGGVYLLHMNPYVRTILYTNIFHVEKYIESYGMYAYTLVFVLTTFFVCVIVEFIRKQLYNLIETPFVKRFN